MNIRSKLKTLYQRLKPRNRVQKNLYMLVSFLVLVAVGLLIWKTQSKTTTIKQNYHIEDVSTIVKITMKDREGGNIVLEKKSDSLWVVDGKSECNYKTISNFLETLGNMRIRETVPAAAVNNVIKSIATAGVTADIYTEDYLIDFWFIRLFKHTHLNRTLFVGHETQDRMGTYMLRKGDKEPRVMYIPMFRGYISSRFVARADAWKSHNIFRYRQSEIKRLKVDIPNQPLQSFSLVNNGRGFDFIDCNNVKINNFDTAKVVALLSCFVNMNYESVAKNIDKVQRDTIFTHKPLYVISIENNKGKKDHLTIYLKPGEQEVESSDQRRGFFLAMSDINRCYALTNKTSDTLIMQYFVLDNVLQPAAYYRSVYR